MSAPLTEYAPCRELSPFVEFFWKGDFNANAAGRLSQRVIPNGYVELILHLTDLHCDLYNADTWSQSPDYTIIGLFTQPYEVQFGNHVKAFGIRFKPEGTYNIFGVPSSEFSESYEDMSLVLGTAFRDFCDRLREENDVKSMIGMAEDYLLKTANRNKLSIGYINHAAELIRQARGSLRIEDIIRKVYISPRQLEREFKIKLGMSPKHYLRISRMNEVHRLLETNKQLNFTEIAHRSGYTDQAHFIKDFKKITGVRPTIFVKEREQFLVNMRLAEITP